MRFKLKKFLLVLAFIALIPFLMHVMEVLRFKPRKVVPRERLQIPPLPATGTCDNSKCNPTKDGMLNVHIVPHSHDDVGWKKTMDQYYTGRGGGNSESFYHGTECTRCVLNNAVRELLVNTSRRFIFVEMAFFSVWFNEQTEQMKKDVKQLIDERRLELIIGGWCMSDSATTYYDDVIDQHTHGFQWIENEFGECAMPKTAWHVDQFGHSREHSSLFAQMGFDGLFLGRIDFQDQQRRRSTGNMETIWMTSPDNLGNKASLFTSAMYDGYFSPARFRWEGWGPGMLSERNSENYVKAFVDIATQRAKAYRTNHVLIPFGGDFAFNTAAGWFDGIDHLIKFVNAKQASGGKVNVLYSTPTCYTNSVNRENRKGKTLETMTSDFFPYGTVPGTFWTGFFTSRPGLKRHVKVASSLLQSCRQLAVLGRLEQFTSNVNRLKEAVAVLQHHDAITGTEMQHVTDDYNRMLSDGEIACQTVIDRGYRSILHAPDLPQNEFCHQLNISVCDISENSQQFTVTLFNALGSIVTQFVRIPVGEGEYNVYGEGKDITADIVPIPKSTLNIPERGSSVAKAEVVFPATLQPLGIQSYRVERKTGSSGVPVYQDNTKEDIVIDNQFLSLTVDATTGLTKTLTNVESGKSIEFQQSYLYYLSSEGQVRDPNDQGGPEGFLGTHRRPSGAYSFNPKEDTEPIMLRGPEANGVKISTFKGSNALEIHQEFSPWVSQVVRLYDGAPYLELEWTVGPIPDEDKETKDVISRFTTNMKTAGVVYTDSNGREMIKRRLNTREMWHLNVTSPVSGNYYPVTGRISLQDEDEDTVLTVLTDRSQGGASLKNGQMELMIHRRTFKDDDLGVEEPLNEKGIDGQGLIIRGKHYVFFNTKENAAADYRPIGLQVHRQPTISFMGKIPTEYKDMLYNTWSGLRTALPYNMHLLTLDLVPGKKDVVLLRLENYFERSEDSSVAEVELETLFTDFEVGWVRELSLGANHDVASVSRLRWTTDAGETTPSEIGSSDAVYMHQAPFRIVLQPMEIRTFHLQIIKKNTDVGT